jgi:hypothetical protein
VGRQAAELTRAPAQLEVWLPVCEVCGQIGKVPMPNGNRGYVAFCTGPASDSHHKVHMQRRRFIEAPPEEE